MISTLSNFYKPEIRGILFIGNRVGRLTVTNKPGTVTTSHSRNGKTSGMLLPETSAAP